MGIPNSALVQQKPSNSTDLANAVVDGSFATTLSFPARSGVFMPWGPFNVVIYGAGGLNAAWTGSIQLERSFDGGTTWIICGIGGAGQQAIWTTGADVSFTAGEPEKGVLYRLSCTALSVGPLLYRMSMTGQAALAMAVSSVI